MDAPGARERGLFRPRPPASATDTALAWLRHRRSTSKRGDQPQDLLLRQGFVRPPEPSDDGLARSPLAELARTDRPALPILLNALWLAQQAVRSGRPPAIVDLHAWKRETRQSTELRPSWSNLIWGDDVPTTKDDVERTRLKAARRDGVRDAFRFLISHGFVTIGDDGKRHLLFDDRRGWSSGGDPGALYTLPVPRGRSSEAYTEPTVPVPVELIVNGWLRVLSAAAIHTYLALWANREGSPPVAFVAPGRGGPSRTQYQRGVTELYRWQLIDPVSADRERFQRKGRLTPAERAGPIASIRYLLRRPGEPWAVTQRSR